MTKDKEDDKPAPHAEEEHKQSAHQDEPEEAEIEASEVGDVTDEPEPEDAPAKDKSAKTNKLQELWQWALTNKKISIPAAALVLFVLIFALPMTRYSVLGLFLRQNFQVVVLDSQTNKPISSATVTLDGKRAVTNAEGRASIRVPVGEAKLLVTKAYYKSVSQEVVAPIKKPSSPLIVKFEATGRPVQVTVTNKVTDKAVAGATISAEKSQAKTNEKGEAVLVVPATKKELAATITTDGYNKVAVTLKVSEQKDPANSIELTPSGKIYVLSNASGKIDLVKSDLDGANRQTVLAGTGKEDKHNTILFASRDWKYIALLSQRDGGEYAKLFLVETETDKVTTMDEGEAVFTIHGWSANRLIYTVDRQNISEWQSKRQAIKSYHAPSKKITTLANTNAQGEYTSYVYENFENTFVLDQEVVYTVSWSSSRVSNYYPVLIDGKKASINSVQSDGSQKKTIKTYDFPYLSSRSAEFGEVYVLIQDNVDGRVDKYLNRKIESTTLTNEDFYSGDSYPTYAVSPSGKKTLWSDFRDGKNVLFVGDGSGENGQQIGSSEDFTVYGWFTDEYLLLTRKGSEMRILPVDGLQGGVDASLKISDYYKPNYSVRGYGYGYGG